MLVMASMTSAEARQPRAGRSLPLTQTSDYEIISLDEEIETMTLPVMTADLSDAKIDTTENYEYSLAHIRKPEVPSIYSLPYSWTRNVPDWKKLWVNTGVFAGAFVGTLLVLECLPEDATTWNRAAIQQVPPFKRWYRNIFVRNPELDHDKWVFNYVLHPYAGAVYFMAARSAGFNFWRSFLYCSLVSNVGWEFGIEAFMERPSYQDLVITPVVGSLIGECFYRLKRHIVSNDYRLWGSPVVGNVVAFLIDPVNEVTGLFGHNKARRLYKPEDSGRTYGVSSTLMPSIVGDAPGFTFSCTF